jgi:integrase
MISKKIEKTHRQYAIKAKTVCSQAAKTYGHTSPFSVPPTIVVEHLISRKPTIAKNTWYQYKNALRYHFQSLITEETDRVLTEELQTAITILGTTTAAGALKYGTKTSSGKQKGIKKADFMTLVSYLNNHVGKHLYARSLLTWLQAGRLVGLRPSEWASAFIDNSTHDPLLMVSNAKTTHGRGNGESRSLNLKGLDAEELSWIQDMLDMINGYRSEMTFSSLQTRIGDYMKFVTRKCFGHRNTYPTLYSLRHQFSANAKFSGATRAEIAAMMGHGSDATAGTHYAKRRSGDSTVNVKPEPTEVRRVRQKAKTFIPKPNPNV